MFSNQVLSKLVVLYVSPPNVTFQNKSSSFQSKKKNSTNHAFRAGFVIIIAALEPIIG